MSFFCIAVPFLHGELRPDAPFSGIFRICPGLPESKESGYASIEWPLSPAEALACLRDIENLSQADISLEALRAHDHYERAKSTERGEQTDLRRRLAENKHPIQAKPNPAEPYRERARQAQRLLVMAWLQEAQLLELEPLNQRVLDAAGTLQALLDAEAPTPSDAPRTMPGASAAQEDAGDLALLPAWKPVIESLGLLVPPDVPFYTSDPRIIDHLTEMDLCQNPLAPDALPGTFPSVTLRGEVLPLWQALGYSRPQDSKPWLNSPRLFIIA